MWRGGSVPGRRVSRRSSVGALARRDRGRLDLGRAKLLLLGREEPRGPHVLRHEQACCLSRVGDQTLRGTDDLVLFFCREAQPSLVHSVREAERSADDVAGLLEIGHEGQDFVDATVVRLVGYVWVQRNEISFDGGIEPIKYAVESLAFTGVAAVRSFECVPELLHHVFKHVGHAERLARRSADCHHGGFSGSRVQVNRQRRVRCVHVVRQKTP